MPRRVFDRKPDGYRQKSKQNRKTCETSSDEFFYSIPNSELLTVLIIFTVIIVIIFLYIFKFVTRDCNFNDSTNGAVGIYLSMVGLPVGVVLSFIVATSWSAFADAANKENEEATKLLLLYNVLSDLPGSEPIREAIKVYTSFIITDEFPLMADGIQSREGLAIILKIGDMIYDLNPQPGKETVLYNQSINMYQEIMSLRIIRMGYVSYGLAPELWWVLILGVVIVIVMSFFIYIRSWCLHAILVAMASATLVALLFLIVALNYPYRGDFGLDSVPFEIALVNMNNPPTTDLIEIDTDDESCCSSEDSWSSDEEEGRHLSKVADLAKKQKSIMKFTNEEARPDKKKLKKILIKYRSQS